MPEERLLGLHQCYPNIIDAVPVPVFQIVCQGFQQDSSDYLLYIPVYLVILRKFDRLHIFSQGESLPCSGKLKYN